MSSPKNKGLKPPKTGTLFLAFIAASAFFIILITLLNAPTKPQKNNILYQRLSVNQTLKAYNQTHLRVYYSELSTESARQQEVLQKMNNTLIEMINADENTETAEKDNVTKIPTIFIINPPRYEKLEGYSTLKEINHTMQKVKR